MLTRMGQPHKGKRVLTQSRVTVPLARRIDRMAKQRGQTRSDFVAELLEISLRHTDELPPVPARQQEELPLTG